MMRRLFFAALTGLLFAVMFSGQAMAEIRKGAVTLSPMAGQVLFEEDEGLDDSPLFTLGLGYNFTKHWGGEFVAGYSDTSPIDGDGHINMYTARGDLLYHITPDEVATFYLAVGAGMSQYDARGKLSEAGEDEDMLLNYGVGLKAFLTENAGLRFDARHVMTAENIDFDGDEYNQFQYSGGLFYQMGSGAAAAEVSDSDGDGVSDGLDECPGTPAGATVDSLGCEVAAQSSDSDGDGVTDKLDQCPGTPEGTMVNVHGCPNDSDGDGVPNFRDRCADTPEGTKVDMYGCALDTAPDADGDGVADADDKCPGTPADVPVNDNGCPRDSDGDFVFDFEDKCPDTPEGDLVDAEGCSVELEEPESISLDVQFETGSAALRPNQEQELDKAGELLQRYPNATIVVEGHTDSIGPEGFNRELSRKRADSVRTYLLKSLEIGAARIKAVGYGESQPIAPNNTPEGRMKNRRVEVTVEP